MMNSIFVLLKRFVVSAVSDNLGLKALAAILAVIFYFLVMFQEERSSNFDVQVEWNLPQPSSGLVLSSPLPDEIRVRLKGPSSTIQSVKPEGIKSIRVDLSRKGEGTSHYYFSEDEIEIPTRTKLVNVTPESVLVKLERLVTKRVPVQARTFGKLEMGTELAGRPVISPSAVSVVGPASTMRNISVVETEDIDIENRTIGEYRDVVPAKRIEGVDIRNGDEIEITMKVRWIPGQRVLSNLKLVARGTELFAELNPGVVGISLSGPQSALRNLDPAKIFPVVAIPEEHKNRVGVFTADVTLEGLPDDVFATSVTPEKVQVRLTSSPAEGKKNSKRER